MKTRLTTAILDQIRNERNGEVINPPLVSSVIASYGAPTQHLNFLTNIARLGINKANPKEPTLQVYNDFFAEDFLNETESYYTNESSHFISINSISDYMKKVSNKPTTA